MSRATHTLLVIGCAFGLYLCTAGPSLVPYRDAGEMATSVPTLGILHPTSYPFYSITGFVFGQLPLGNPAYRLNIFSALAMACAWGMLWLLLRHMEGKLAALGTTLLGALSYHFWWHSAVSEMYALNILFLAALLWAFNRRQFLLWAYFFGLGLANRADLLLTLPAFAAAFVLDPDPDLRQGGKLWWGMIACVGLGLTLYVYLPLRALQQPLMNWNDPSTLERFLRSVLRKGYGGGLDLLSTSYALGENFKSEMGLYGMHLWRDYVYVGIPLALFGAVALFRARRPWFALALTGWLVTGPVFIFLGNLPPNTHAVAILEAAYLMPDVFFLLFVAAGLASLGLFFPGQWKWGLAGLLMMAVGWNVKSVFPAVNQRSNFIAVDYIRNTYAALPAPSLIVGRSDVPLFSLYYGHWISPQPSGRVPVAQGLARSAWYQTMLQRDESGIYLAPLKTIADWTQLQRQNPGWALFGAYDMDWPEDGNAHFLAHGLVNAFTTQVPSAKEKETSQAVSRVLLHDLAVYRGVYVYGHYRDFFTNELVESYAKAWMSVGDADALRAAWALKPDMPYAPFQLGYLFFMKGDYATAARYYAATLANFTALEQLAADWKTFPALRDSIHRDHEQALQHWTLLQNHLQRKVSKVQ